MNSIRRLVALRLMVVCTLLWAVGCLTIYWIVRHGMIKEYDHALRANAQALVAMTEQTTDRLEFSYDRDHLPGFSRYGRANYFQLWRPDGSTLGRSPSLTNADLALPSGLQTAHHAWEVVLPDGLPGRAIGLKFIPTIDDEQPSAKRLPAAQSEVTLVVARHRIDLDRHLGILESALLLVGLFMAAATLLVVPVAVRDGLRPLAQLQEHASKIGALSLHLRFPTVDLPIELLPIAERLNDLLARLEATFIRERQFSADVAHELRTPIAELRSLAEVALKWPDGANAGHAAWQDALDVALQMELLATDLLTIARCEARLLEVRFQPVELAPLLKNIWQPLAEKAHAKNLVCTWTVPDEAAWNTDPTLLSAVLTNLLGNAVEYSPPGGTLSLGLEVNGSLQIANTTTDLQPEDLAHMFQRFWRKDRSRSTAGHSGLGLAVAKAYAEAIGLCLKADLSTPNTFTVTISKGTNL